MNKQNKTLLILAVIGVALILFVFALAWSAVHASAHYAKHHHQIDPCLYEANENVAQCLTPTPELTGEPTPTVSPCDELTEEVAFNAPCVTPTIEVTPTVEVTTEPTAGGSAQQGGSGVSDGQHTAPDGLGCAVHECKAEPTLTPCTETTCGWK